MTRLIRADLTRMLKKKCFWAACIIMAAIAIFEVITSFVSMKSTGNPEYLENYLFSIAMLGIFALAPFVGSFIGDEYSNGTMRNKVAMGHSRTAIYTSKLISMFVAGIIFIASYMIPLLIAGSLLLERANPWWMILALTGAMLFEYLAFTAIFTFISMLSKSKSRSGTVCLMLTIVLIVGAIIANSVLETPEYVEADQLYTIEEIAQQDLEKDQIVENPDYLPEGSLRTALTTFQDYTPAGASILLASHRVDMGWKIAASSLVWFLVMTGLGYTLFRRKDLN